MKLAWRVIAATLLTAGMAGVFYVYIVVLSTGTTPLLAGVLAFACLMTGVVALYPHANPAPDAPPKPYVQVDWAVQETCLKFACPCTPNKLIHVCGWTFGVLQCTNCGSTYQLPERLEANNLTE